MSRSDIASIEDRRPFYLYVDEFQNFATDSFATILSEARKYGLNLTVANQYISQMSDTVRNAVFGNVGTMISFRVSADDSPILSKQFEPQFEPNDLLQMHNRNFVVNMVINGEKAPAFSARTLNLPPAQTDNTHLIIENTRARYGQPRSAIEESINNRIMPPENLVVKRPGPAYTPPKSEEQRETDRRERESTMVAQGKQWPISNVTPDEVNSALQAAKEQGTTATPGRTEADRRPLAAFGSEENSAAKRKRPRTRKRKPSDGEEPSRRAENTPNHPRIIRENAPASSPHNDPTILSIR